MKTIKKILERLHEIKRNILSDLSPKMKKLKNLNAEAEKTYWIPKRIVLKWMLFGYFELWSIQMENYNKRYAQLDIWWKNRCEKLLPDELTQWVVRIWNQIWPIWKSGYRLEELVEKIRLMQNLSGKGDILKITIIYEEFSQKSYKRLHLLNMKDAVFSVDFIPLPKPTHFGLNDLYAKFTSHKNIIPWPIYQMNVGRSRLSRIMLAVGIVK